MAHYAATLVMFVTLATVLFTYAANLNFFQDDRISYDKIDISIYLKDSVEVKRAPGPNT